MDEMEDKIKTIIQSFQGINSYYTTEGIGILRPCPRWFHEEIKPLVITRINKVLKGEDKKTIKKILEEIDNILDRNIDIEYPREFHKYIKPEILEILKNNLL